MSLYNWSGIKWIVYYDNPKDGVGPLGLIAVFDKRENADEFVIENFTTNEIVLGKVRITNTVHRTRAFKRG